MITNQKLTLSIIWTSLIPMLLLILGTTSHANNNPPKEWLLPEVATKILRESDYGLTVGGGTGNIGTSKMAEKELGYRSSISFVESEKGFIPDLVKKAFEDSFEKARESGLLDGDASCSSMGDKDSLWVSHHWQYQSSAQGIVGSLVIWFPDVKKKRMKMIVVVDERRESSKK